MQADQVAEIVEGVIRRRRTEKVLGSVGSSHPMSEEIARLNDPKVRRSIEAAGSAPFHFRRGVDGLAEPWRAYVLWHSAAQRLSAILLGQLGAQNKLPQLAAACSALVLVTWLPEPVDAQETDEASAARDVQVMRNEEHLAAASAMVQNFLILLTAHNLGSYWSSGGRLRSPASLKQLGISSDERLLAAVFIEYPETQDAAVSRKLGAHRDARSLGWIREVRL
ncbi:MAG: nitroreductase family protein [Acidobacteriota bacterium]